MKITELKTQRPQPSEQQKRLDSYRLAMEKLNAEKQSKKQGKTAC